MRLVDRRHPPGRHVGGTLPGFDTAHPSHPRLAYLLRLQSYPLDVLCMLDSRERSYKFYTVATFLAPNKCCPAYIRDP